MSENQRKPVKKGWIIALAAAFILLFALFTANAATDGAIFNGELFEGLIVRFNGKETRLNDYEYTVELTTDANGEEVVRYSFDLPNDQKVDVYVAEDCTESIDQTDSNSNSSRITADDVK